jgi:membrane-associated protease RseP (regulator of RpoE activity)
MINLDMVGRLENNQIAISGTGTSPVWNKLLPMVKQGNLTYKGSESGVGPSDHTSFYLRNIPVLHFFTGTHPDYHKPGDDADKINYSGIRRISEFIIELINLSAKEPEILFTKTKDQEQGKAPRFSVTLGIIPDYLYDGKGVRMDGVTEGKPGFKAGMKAGDIILKLGDVPVLDMQSYMKALSSFKKGDTVNALILRDSSEITLEVKF